MDAKIWRETMSFIGDKLPVAGAFSTATSIDLDHPAFAAMLQKLSPFLSHFSESLQLAPRSSLELSSSCSDFPMITAVSDFLFQMMDAALEDLHSCAHSPVFVSLLRCCLKLPSLLDFDRSLAFEKSAALLQVLRKLSSFAPIPLFGLDDGSSGTLDRGVTLVSRSVSLQFLRSSGNSSHQVEVREEYRGIREFDHEHLLPLIEVFADALLVNRCFREYTRKAGWRSCITNSFINKFQGHGCVGICLELMAAHFLLSFHDNMAVLKFTSSLFWSFNENVRVLELSLSDAIILLSMSVKRRAPLLLQAHIASLVSRCINININMKDVPEDQDLGVLENTFLIALEESFLMYLRHISGLCHLMHDSLDGYLVSPDLDLVMLEIENPTSFESLVTAKTFRQINEKETELLKSLNHRLKGKPLLIENMKHECISYMEQIEIVLGVSYAEEISSMLRRVVLKSFSLVKWKIMQQWIEENGNEDLCYLASTLKLMGCSLLQIVLSIRENNGQRDQGLLEDHTYNKVNAYMSRFLKYLRKKTMTNHNRIHIDIGLNTDANEAAKSMIAHFLSFLPFSFGSRAEFLWKGCIFLLVVLVELSAVSRGNLDALKVILADSEYCSDLKSSRDGIFDPILEQVTTSSVSCNDTVPQRSSLSIALDIQRTKVICSNEKKDKDLPQPGRKDESASTCNGESFIKAILTLDAQSHHESNADHEDLLDFVVCKPEKDYTKWLKQRTKFRRWVYEKDAVKRAQRKRDVRKFLSAR